MVELCTYVLEGKGKRVLSGALFQLLRIEWSFQCIILALCSGTFSVMAVTL